MIAFCPECEYSIETVLADDKRGELCPSCGCIFELDSNGKITISPLNQFPNVRLADLGKGNVCTGFGGIVGQVPRVKRKRKD